MGRFRDRLKEPRTWVLIGLGAVSLMLVLWFSRALSPVLAAGVVAYLLDGPVMRLERWRLPRMLATLLILLGSLLVTVLLLFSVLPTVIEQLNALAGQVPRLITNLQRWVMDLPEVFPDSPAQEFLGSLRVQVDNQLGHVASALLSWAGGTIGNTVNAVIVVFLVFFILKDKERIRAYLIRLVPPMGSDLVQRIAHDIDRQMGRFIKGKVIVVLLLFVLATTVFAVMGLNYFLLLGILTGLSTFIPYIGAIVVAVPVVLTGLLQWGWPVGALGTLAAYMVIQAVDANYLTPVIIGRETNIHPVAIILAILICGALWGFWGVFFAVPIAVIVKSVLDLVYFPSRESTDGAPVTPASSEAVAGSGGDKVSSRPGRGEEA